jgi:hypothetical protein
MTVGTFIKVLQKVMHHFFPGNSAIAKRAPKGRPNSTPIKRADPLTVNEVIDILMTSLSRLNMSLNAWEMVSSIIRIFVDERKIHWQH